MIFMTKNNAIYKHLILFFVLLFNFACSKEELLPDNNQEPVQNEMKFRFRHPEGCETSFTRVTDTEFESGDRISLFVKEAEKPLEISGNVINNEPLEFNGTSWKSRKALYWGKGEYNVYSLFPYNNDIKSITDHSFEVAEDQDNLNSSGMPGYLASDLLYASSGSIKSSADPVEMKFRHLLSKITIRIIKGPEYEGELPEDMSLYLLNTIRKGTIDLEAGIATADSKNERSTIKAKKISSNTFTAIVVPQRLENRVPLIEVITGNTSLLFESKFLFKPGMHHIVNFIISRNPDRNRIYIAGEQNNWN